MIRRNTMTGRQGGEIMSAGDDNLTTGLGEIRLLSPNLWAGTWGGTSEDYGECVTADSLDNIYVGGCYKMQVDFDPGPGVDNHGTSSSSYEGFMSKFNNSGEYQWMRDLNGGYDQYIHAVCTNSSNYIYLSVDSTYEMDLAPTEAPCNEDPYPIAAENDEDIFLVKYLSDGCW